MRDKSGRNYWDEFSGKTSLNSGAKKAIGISQEYLTALYFLPFSSMLYHMIFQMSYFESIKKSGNIGYRTSPIPEYTFGLKIVIPAPPQCHVSCLKGKIACLFEIS